MQLKQAIEIHLQYMQVATNHDRWPEEVKRANRILGTYLRHFNWNLIEKPKDPKSVPHTEHRGDW